ncbi:MAG: response regulator [Halothiobacillaceae bacterium]|nr:response regulator [Halothiobacillaceae bacterium]
MHDEAQTLGPATILVVDDTPENVDVLRGILQPDYRVKVAMNGQRALSIMRNGELPDLILLDVMMPGLSGYDVCRQLKEDVTTAAIPVIFVTALTDVEDEEYGFRAGAVDYITKPVSAPIVRARVRTHLALFNQKRHLEQLVRSRTAELLQTRLQIIRALGRAAEYRDENTGMHVVRMSHYSRLIAVEAGFSDDEADMLLNAAPMHDLGKIAVPDSVLQKAGPLDETEWAQMRQHPQVGADILGSIQPSSPLIEMARQIALTHHERWDGRGYPAGLAGESIPRVGRVVALADVFDALTSERPYKQAWSWEEALAHIQAESGSHFDPALVPALARALPAMMEIRSFCAQSESRGDTV